MARKTLLTEAEIRQFMKLANIKPLQEMGGELPVLPGMRDEEEDEPGMRDMREGEDEDEDPPGMRGMREGEEEDEEPGMRDMREAEDEDEEPGMRDMREQEDEEAPAPEMPAPEGGEFDARVGRRVRLGGEGRDAARGLHPLLLGVEAEGVVRIPAPGVQRAAPRDDGGVAAAGEDGLGGEGGVAMGDSVAVGEGERGGGGDGPVERTLAGGDGGGVKAELAILTAAPLHVGERGGRARSGRKTGREREREMCPRGRRTHHEQGLVDGVAFGDVARRRVLGRHVGRDRG